MRSLGVLWEQLRQYPSALAGAALIVLLVILSLSAPFVLPYQEAVRLWRGGEGVWITNPRNAVPAWVNYFPGVNLPTTIRVRSGEAGAEKKVVDLGGGLRELFIPLSFEFAYDDFPQELTLFFRAAFEHAAPHVQAEWHTPDGRVISLGDRTVRAEDAYRISQDSRLQRRLGGRPPEIALFAPPDGSAAKPIRGTHRVEITALLFEETSDLEAELVVYGRAHGIAGTDHRRRDLSVALLWGAPVALSFGLLAAVGTTVTTLVVAAVGVWFGNRVDGIIQRITEVNMILPTLPLLIMIGTFYSRSLWVMLGAIVALGIFGAGVKTYRAMFLQIKGAPYIEAARAYGASDLRIIFRYMIPRVVPVLVPQFVILIPSYVFLESTLSLLGLGDPVIPTWGKVLNDAYHEGALYKGYYYWMLQPAALLMMTGLGFAMLGFALDRVFNPKLREM